MQRGDDRQDRAPVSMADRVSGGGAACLEAHCPLGGLGWRSQEEDLRALLVSPTPVQLVGGAAEGTIVLPGFSLDMLALAALPCSSASRPSPGRRRPGAPTMPMG